MLKRGRLIFALVIILGLLFGAGIFARMNYVVPIIMYHSLVPHPTPENRLSVSLGTFRKQIRFLKERRYHVVPLAELEGLVSSGKRIPPKTIAITFDDGYKDNFTLAFPVLKEYGLPVTMFIIVNEVGRSDRLSWDEIKEMQASGLVYFGSHALGPDPLTKAGNEQELKRQIFGSKIALEERLGRQVTAFSYPEGRFNAQIRGLVMAAGYKLAVATNPGKRFSNCDVFALKRLRISENAGNLFVFWVETSGYYNFMRERRHK